MKLVTYRTDAGPRLGVLLEDKVLDAQKAQIRKSGRMAAAFSSMQALIESEDLSVLKALAAAPHAEDMIHLTSQSQLLAPLPEPIQIRDALCFWDHLGGALAAARRAGIDVDAREGQLKAAFDQRPFWYTTNRFSMVGPGQTIDWPSYSTEIDYELEMGVVIGRGGRNIAPDDAMDHVFGYTIFNDFSARDTQRLESAFGIGFSKSKGFDQSNGLGPCIVTADEFEPYAARMISRINGEVQCDALASTINHKFEQVIAWLSKDEMLRPGEIFCSGTVGGGGGLETGRLLKDGDVIELEIVGIGAMSHTIHAPHARP